MLAGPAEVKPPAAVMETLKEGLAGMPTPCGSGHDSPTGGGRARLAVRHGPQAVEHCVKVVNDLRKLLDGITGLRS